MKVILGIIPGQGSAWPAPPGGFHVRGLALLGAQIRRVSRHRWRQRLPGAHRRPGPSRPGAPRGAHRAGPPGRRGTVFGVRHGGDHGPGGVRPPRRHRGRVRTLPDVDARGRRVGRRRPHVQETPPLVKGNFKVSSLLKVEIMDAFEEESSPQTIVPGGNPVYN